MEISQNLEFLVRGRRSLRDLRREVDGPAGVVLDLIARHAGVQRSNRQLLGLGVGLEDTKIRDQPGWALGLEPKLGAILAAGSMSERRDEVDPVDECPAGVTSLTDEIMGRWYTDGFRSRHPDVVARSAAMLAQVSVQGYVGCAEALKAVPYFDRLQTMGVPVLYIVGRHDGVAPETMAAMAARTPGSTIEVIDPGAHFPNVENPRAFNQVMADWLGIA